MKMRSHILLAFTMVLAGCTPYHRVDFVVCAADSGVPVGAVRLTGYPEPGGITFTDFLRPNWTYAETPESLTDLSGRAQLRVPLNTPKGVSRLNPDGSRIPKKEWVASRVLLEKDGFKDKWVYKTLLEWRALTSPIYVKLDRE